jgi:hypothetical protein
VTSCNQGASLSDVINLPKMLKAKFSYFTHTGKFYSSACGLIRENWAQLSNLPKTRRSQIIQDNEGLIPGMADRASEFFIHINDHTNKMLVLPEMRETAT